MRKTKSKRKFSWFLAAFLTVSLAGTVPALHPARADTWRVNPKLSSAAQDIFYLVEKLEGLLAPAGYTLDRESIDIEEKVVVGGLGSSAILETPEYAARYVFFRAKSAQDGKTYEGSIYLIIARTENTGRPLVPLNSSSRPYQSRSWGRPLFISLSVGILPKDFALDVRPNDFHFHPPF